MPHPHFRTAWEEDSYWRHYENYLDMKQEEEYEKKQNAHKSSPQAKPESGNEKITSTIFRIPENADDALDPMMCPLHVLKMTGSLCYQMNADGDYPPGAPPCHGCMLGISDAAKLSTKMNN